jgi:hypothetical protein
MTGVDGAATVDLCADRACQQRLGSATVDTSGAAAQPDQPLAPGPVFWRVRAGETTSATWELFVGKRSAPADTSYGATLDLDGDGMVDAAVSATGLVAVYLGGAAGLGRTPTILSNSDDAGAGFGFVLAAAGDLNGDGYGDLAVGECGRDVGRVHVYFGGPSGPSASASQALDSPDGKSGFGCRVAGAGDLDGDGYADLAVARIGPDFSGSLYIYKGGARGLSMTAARIDSPDRMPSRLGYSLAGVGDLDGDGFADLVASEIDYSDLSGQAHVYRGGPDGISNQRVVSLASPDASGLQFGDSVASAGDVDGDGYPDFVVGAAAAPNVQLPGKAHLYLGGPGRVTTAAQPVDLTRASDGTTGFAAEVEGGGDFNGDGYADVVVGSSSELTVFYGGGSLTGWLSLNAVGQGSGPRHLALVGDLDGDGYADLLVGDGVGVQAFLGGANAIDGGRVFDLTPPAGASGFGLSVL